VKAPSIVAAVSNGLNQEPLNETASTTRSRVQLSRMPGARSSEMLGDV
jgi:hypothetical protein